MLSYHNFLVTKLKNHIDTIVNIKLPLDVIADHSTYIKEIVEEIQNNKRKSKVKHFLLYERYKEVLC